MRLETAESTIVPLLFMHPEPSESDTQRRTHKHWNIRHPSANGSSSLALWMSRTLRHPFSGEYLGFLRPPLSDFSSANEGISVSLQTTYCKHVT